MRVRERKTDVTDEKSDHPAGNMGADGVLVSPPVFKTEREARDVSGGFDSHPFPPVNRPQRRVKSALAAFFARFGRKYTIGLYPPFSEYEGVKLYRVRFIPRKGGLPEIGARTRQLSAPTPFSCPTKRRSSSRRTRYLLRFLRPAPNPAANRFHT